MLCELRVTLPSETPVVDCQISPHVLLRRPADPLDLLQDRPSLDRCDLRFSWYRTQTDRKVKTCSVHESEVATFQCMCCAKSEIAVSESYHCSAKCFFDSWHHHRILHAQAAIAAPVQGTQDGDDQALGEFQTPASIVERDGSSWLEVGCSKTYKPTIEDVGYVLRLECVAVDTITGQVLAPPNIKLTAPVIVAPIPDPRRMIQISPVDGFVNLNLEPRVSATGNFSLLSYNVLSDLYANSERYNYCPPWALSWQYRQRNLLREIVGYQADILCLQEVQSDHFENFFAPELDKLGYSVVYKKKTNEVYTGAQYTADGCATFYRRGRFKEVKKYEVEFNKAAQSMVESLVTLTPYQKKKFLTRFIKDNVALILVLCLKENGSASDFSQSGNNQLICVANTHIHANPELIDVKLWQVLTLVKGLEKIFSSAEIPVLLCGDFNSLPGSAAHDLLVMGKVDPNHEELATDPLGIFQKSALSHLMPLVSAYSFSSPTIGRTKNLEYQRRQMDPRTNEPLFTNFTKNFSGTIDYIFYTADALVVEGLLELLDEETVSKGTALPSPEWSSDHMALMANFRLKPKIQRLQPQFPISEKLLSFSSSQTKAHHIEPD